MIVVLEVQAGPSSGKSIRVPTGRSVKVGRGSQSDISFAKDAYLSGAHFSLECDDTTCSINDLSSRNGTFVNGKRVQRSLLRDGDMIVAGCTVLSVRLQPNDSIPLVGGADQSTAANDPEVAAETEAETAEKERPNLAAADEQHRLSQPKAAPSASVLV
jgi:pSer/pThr/pTyr-binding forkhead associated (FHA) protein